MIDTGNIDVFLGLDVGKGEHHATAVTPAGKKAFDKRMPNTEPKLRELFAKLQAKHGTVLVVVDQPASIGALPLAIARDMGCPVAYLPGQTMRRIADLYPGEAKTDAKDAFIIADAARAMPHTLRAIDGEDETIAELEMIVGFDDDLAGEATRVANRLHGLLTQIHPVAGTSPRAAVAAPGRPHPAGTVRVTGPDPQGRQASAGHPAATEGTADGRALGRGHLRRPGRADRCRSRHRGGGADRPEPRRVADGRARPAQAAGRADRGTAGGPPSFQGPDVDAGNRRQDRRSRVLIEVGDGSTFPTAGHLAAYAGLAPATRSSGSSIRGEQPSRRGNKQLKRAFFLSRVRGAR
ncbi:IS110 family transposase ISSam1 [Streptomyces violaceorubidus]